MICCRNARAPTLRCRRVARQPRLSPFLARSPATPGAPRSPRRVTVPPPPPPASSAAAAVAASTSATASATAPSASATITPKAGDAAAAAPGPEPEPCDALIVGAGPAGLAAALLLSQRAGWDRIVVLERRPSVDAEEMDRAFVYKVDGRGLSVTDAAGVTAEVVARGVLGDNLACTQVLPDGSCVDVPFTNQGDRHRPYALIPRRNLLAALRSGLKEAEREGRVRLLHGARVTNVDLPPPSTTAAAAAAAATTAPIVVHAMHEASSFTAAAAAAGDSGGGGVTAGGSYELLRFAPRLLVGADGLNSPVRRKMEAWAAGGGGDGSERYSPVVLDSPSAGLVYKVLPLPPNTPFRRRKGGVSPPPPQQQQQQQRHLRQGEELRNHQQSPARGGHGYPPAQHWAHTTSETNAAATATATATVETTLPTVATATATATVVATLDPPATAAAAVTATAAVTADGDDRLDNSRLCVLVGVDAPRTRAMRLGLWPLRDSSAHRTANFIAPPDHEFWSLATGRELGEFLQESFPQLDIPALFTEQQLEAAAASRGGNFPRPQYLRNFIAVLPRGTAAVAAGATGVEAIGGSSSGGGVALVGDAAHCFPPDLAQGVNCALLDVLVLVEALDETDGDLARALPLYESRRAPEAAALAELVTFGAPFQYTQDKLRMTLWFANVALRAVLSRAAPWAFSPQTFQLLQRTELSYAQVLDRVQATTRRIWALVGLTTAAAAVALGAIAPPV